MGLEIERKFLVKDDSWRAHVTQATAIRQGYLNATPERTVRIRIKEGVGVLTIKGKNDGITREEFEYDVPFDEARRLLKLCEKSIIEKVRFLCPYQKSTWEIDEFKGENSGLIVAEVELEKEDQQIEIPDWIGEEVSHDPNYYNASLIAHPFSKWGR